jgi:hypothetical protein
LFDALGSSSSPFLTEKNSDHLVANSPGRKVPFTGLTNADAHARVGLETALVMQAAQYVRFRLGFGLAFVSPYLLTNTVRCNADSHAANGDPRAGDCYPNLWNPQYRPVIDLPGQRFRLVDDVVFDLFATAIGQF